MLELTQLHLWGCLACGKDIPPRRRNACSAECKKITKSLYDIARYPTIRHQKIETACEWQRTNRERKQAYDAERRMLLGTELTRARQEWAVANPEKTREYSRRSARRRRARKLGLDDRRVTRADLEALLATYGGRCGACECDFIDENPLEWDHIIPISRGGRHAIGNFWPLCRSCNRSKSAKLIVEWRFGRVVSVRDVANLPKAFGSQARCL